jgi:predicted enzyme related to lactoylglutathione lyase
VTWSTRRCGGWTPRAQRFYSAALHAPAEPGRAVALGFASAADDPEQEFAARTGFGVHGGQPRPTTMLGYAVPDVDAAAALVRAAGGTAGEAADRPYGRVADCVDDQGVPFALISGAVAAGPVRGLDYAEFRVPDAGRARAFYGTVLGWRFVPGSEAGYWHPATADGELTSPLSGLVGGYPEAAVVPTFRVSDAAAAVAAVREAGGTATDPVPGRHRVGVQCVDDQGGTFAVAEG